MPAGEIKFYNSDKGFGFIKQDEGDDLFFHVSSFDTEPEDITMGQRVVYEIGEGRRGAVANKLFFEEDAIKKAEPEPEPKHEETKAEPEPKLKKKQKQKDYQKSMMNAFLDKHIQSGEPLDFYFSDGSEFQGKILKRDSFHLKVEVDGKRRLIFKHALESVG